MTINLGPCRACGRPATTTRTETKTLRGYNTVQAVQTIAVPVCERHAPRTEPTPIDARAMAEAALMGGTPPPPPSALSGAQAAREDTPEPEPAPAIEAIALDDQPSRDLAGVWTSILGACFIVAQIDLADVDALLAEYDRTDAVMPVLDPTGYAAIKDNVPQHRQIAEAFRALRAAIAAQGA